MLRLSASGLGGIYHHGCELQAHRALRRGRRAASTAAVGSAQSASAQQSATASPHTTRGNDFEAELVRRHVQPADAAWHQSGGAATVERMLQRLAGAVAAVRDAPPSDPPPRQVLHHLRFSPPPGVFDTRGVPVEFATLELDFLFVERDDDDGGSGRVRLTIVDAKASTSMQTHQQVQVGVYHIALAAVLATAQGSAAGGGALAGVYLADVCGIWTPAGGRDAPPTLFPAAPVVHEVRRWLAEELPALAAMDEADADWHYRPACAGCDHEAACHARAVDSRHLSLVPHLSPADKRALAGLPDTLAALDHAYPAVGSGGSAGAGGGDDGLAPLAGAFSQSLSLDDGAGHGGGGGGDGDDGDDDMVPSAAGGGGGGARGGRRGAGGLPLDPPPPPRPLRSLTDIEDLLTAPSSRLLAHAAAGTLPRSVRLAVRRTLAVELPLANPQLLSAVDEGSAATAAPVAAPEPPSPALLRARGPVLHAALATVPVLVRQPCWELACPRHLHVTPPAPDPPADTEAGGSSGTSKKGAKSSAGASGSKMRAASPSPLKQPDFGPAPAATGAGGAGTPARTPSRAGAAGSPAAAAGAVPSPSPRQSPYNTLASPPRSAPGAGPAYREYGVFLTLLLDPYELAAASAADGPLLGGAIAGFQLFWGTYSDTAPCGLALNGSATWAPPAGVPRHPTQPRVPLMSSRQRRGVTDALLVHLHWVLSSQCVEGKAGGYITTSAGAGGGAVAAASAAAAPAAPVGAGAVVSAGSGSPAAARRTGSGVASADSGSSGAAAAAATPAAAVAGGGVADDAAALPAHVQVYVWDGRQRDALLAAVLAAALASEEADDEDNEEEEGQAPPSAACGVPPRPTRARVAAAAAALSRVLAAPATPGGMALSDPVAPSMWPLYGKTPTPSKLEGKNSIDAGTHAEWKARMAAGGVPVDGTSSGGKVDGAALLAAMRARASHAPLLCVAHDAVRDLVAVPVPGWYEVDEAAAWLRLLLPPQPLAASGGSRPPNSRVRASACSQSALYDAWSAGDAGAESAAATSSPQPEPGCRAVELLLQYTCEQLVAVVVSLRRVVDPALLPCHAPPLTAVEVPPLTSTELSSRASVPPLTSQLRRLHFLKLTEARLARAALLADRRCGVQRAHLRFVGWCQLPPTPSEPAGAGGSSSRTPQRRAASSSSSSSAVRSPAGSGGGGNGGSGGVWSAVFVALDNFEAVKPSDPWKDPHSLQRDWLLAPAPREPPTLVDSRVSAEARGTQQPPRRPRHPTAAPAAAAGAPITGAADDDGGGEGAGAGAVPASRAAPLPPYATFPDVLYAGNHNMLAGKNYTLRALRLTTVLGVGVDAQKLPDGLKKCLADLSAQLQRPVHTVELAVDRDSDGQKLQPGSDWFLMPRLYDSTTGQAVARLHELAALPSAAPAAQLLAGVLDPSRVVRFADEPFPAAAAAQGVRALLAQRLAARDARGAAAAAPTADCLAAFRLTESQEHAFSVVLDRRLAVVWGPPGTGKTSFLAATLLLLVLGHAAEAQRLADLDDDEGGARAGGSGSSSSAAAAVRLASSSSSSSAAGAGGGQQQLSVPPLSRGLRVVVTALTNAALAEVQARLNGLRAALLRDATSAGAADQPPLLPLWARRSLDSLAVVKDAGKVASETLLGAMRAGRPVVALGTVWQLTKFDDKRLLNARADTDGANAYEPTSAAGAFDLLVADEASQLLAADFALAARLLHADARVLLAGDHQQLAPIRQGTYTAAAAGGGAPAPLSPPSSSLSQQLPLDSSILELVRAVVAAANGAAAASAAAGVGTQQPPFVLEAQLLESFRMNTPLCALATTFYGSDFRAHDTAAGRRLLRAAAPGEAPYAGTLAEWQSRSAAAPTFTVPLTKVVDGLTDALLTSTGCRVVVTLRAADEGDGQQPGSATSSSSSSAAVRRSRTGAIDHESAASAEATVVVAAVLALLTRTSPHAGGAGTLQPGDIFVATPHKGQRAAVQAALRAVHVPVEVRNTAGDEEGGDGGGGDGAAAAPAPERTGVLVDTVERLQGQQAEVVLCCYGYGDPSKLAGEVDFLYNRHRLNVAVSRARRAAVLIATPHVLTTPPLETALHPDRAAAVEYLRAFAARDAGEVARHGHGAGAGAAAHLDLQLARPGGRRA